MASMQRVYEKVTADQFLQLLFTKHIVEYVECQETIDISKLKLNEKTALSLVKCILSSVKCENIKLLSLSINLCKITAIQFNSVKLDGLDISDSDIEDVDIAGGRVNAIEIRSGGGNFKFNDCRIDTYKQFYKGLDSLYVKNSEAFQEFIIASSSIKKDLFLKCSKIDKLSIDHVNIPTAIFHANSIENISLRNCGVEKLYFDGLNEFPPTVALIDCGIDKPFKTFEIKVRRNEEGREISDSSISLINVVLENLFFQGKGIRTVKFDNLNISECIDLSGIRIQSLVFNTVILKRARVKIHNTKFESPNFVNVKWSENFEDYKYEDFIVNGVGPTFEQYLFKVSSLKETYRDLKVYFSAKQDNFEAMVFLTHELETEHRIKTLETWGFFRGKNIFKGSEWKLWKKSFSFRSWRRNFSDWFILATNYHFSSFGLSWIKPLTIWLVLFHLPLFAWLLYLKYDKIGIGVTIDTEKMSWHAFFNGLNLYLRLIFPVHLYEIPLPYRGEEKIDITSIPDFLMRIASTYFIFLVARGTRKFNFNIGGSKGGG